MLRTVIRLAVAWLAVAVFALAGKALTASHDPLVIGGLLAGLLVVIVWAAFGAVHEAEALAERLGEPLGTLVLTLSIVVIEVALVAAVMLDARGLPTLGRDTMFSVLMIVLNGVVGLGLLVGGLRHREQSFNLQGASAFLSVILPLAVIALVLPSFTTSTSGGTLSPAQAVAFSAATLVLYGLFLWLQTGRHSGFFIAGPEAGKGAVAPEAAHGAARPALAHAGLLLAHLLPIVLLSKSLAKLLDTALEAAGAPAALGGVVIAAIVFTPEALTALKAVRRDQLTRAVNLCLGAATSTLGLTVPAVLLIGLLTHQPVVLGLSPTNMVLLSTTLVLNTLTFSQGRTTMLEGAVHLTLFAVFLVLIFSP